MCGRYALGIRASFARYQLQQNGLDVADAPDDSEVRETFNFPPGSFGLVYRASVPDSGYQGNDQTEGQRLPDEAVNDKQPEDEETSTEASPKATVSATKKQTFDYELKGMKWGLIPFWTKRSPDYGSMMRTINCRDDSLIDSRGMWNTMKQRKRCIVVAQGFYEWLKKGKDKIPHFVKRKDGQLMLFAGLWDCVKYEDVTDKLYTYAIITTDSNKQLNFLHDRMPVILDPNTDALKLWLDPTVNKWCDELQSLLKPYEGELECYPVNKEVGKVGNNSPDFIIPIDSKENKKNIANFFGNTQKNNAKVEELRETIEHEDTENNAPLPIPSNAEGGLKRKAVDDGDHTPKALKLDASAETGSVPRVSPSKPVTPAKSSAKKPRSATSNEGLSKKPSPLKNDSPRITSFFGKKDV